MIVRIMGEGQLDLSEADLDVLNDFDRKLEEAIESGDEARFRVALHDLLARVRADGKPLPDDSLQPSQYILPPPDASMEEVRAMLGDEAHPRQPVAALTGPDGAATTLAAPCFVSGPPVSGRPGPSCPTS